MGSWSTPLDRPIVVGGCNRTAVNGRRIVTGQVVGDGLRRLATAEFDRNILIRTWTFTHLPHC